MKVISVLLMLVGIGGFISAGIAFGDIGIACGIGGAAALLSGVGFWITPKQKG